MRWQSPMHLLPLVDCKGQRCLWPGCCSCSPHHPQFSGCSCPGLLTDLLSQYLLLVTHLAKDKLPRSQGARSSSSIVRSVAGNPLHGPPSDGFEMPESETAAFDPTVDPDELDGLPRQHPLRKMARLKNLRLDRVPAQQLHPRHPRGQLRQRPRARRSGNRPSHSWTPRRS